MLRGVVAGLLLGAIAATWFPLLGNDFVNYDDDLYITSRQPVRDGLGLEGLRWAFTSFQGANWFPLTRLSWMADATLYGLDPRGFHATSLALHAIDALVLFAALSAMTGALWRPALVAALFALHPLQVEPVAWASARKDVLSALFFLLAWWSWALRLGASGRRRALLGLATCGAFALGLLAKQMLVTLPFVLLLFDVWPFARLGPSADGRSADLRSALVEKLPLFALALAGAALAFLAQQAGGTVQSLERIAVGPRLANAAVSYASYLVQALVPTRLAVFYPHPGVDLAPARIAASLALLAALGLLAWRCWPRRPYVAVGVALFVGMLVPVIGLVQIGQSARADRYMYLPIIGLALPVAWGLGEIASRGPLARRLSAALAAAGLLLLALTTHAQVRVWRDSESLFRHALRVTEGNHVAHLNLGLALLHDDRLQEARPHLEAARRLAPASPLALGILGELRLREADWAGAEELLRAALRRGRRDAARWRLGLGRALFERGELEASVESTRASLSARPYLAPAHAQLGLALAGLGRLEEAIASYRRALELDPELAEVHANLGIALAERGDVAGAIAAFERALALDSGLATVHGHLGEALARQGELPAALRRLDTALRLAPDSAELHLLRARLHESRGDEARAIADYRAAVERGAAAPAVLNNLAWLLATAEASSPGEAVALAERAADATGRDSAEILDTLSVAYAAAGRDADAARVGAEALAAAERSGHSELADSIRARLEGR